MTDKDVLRAAMQKVGMLVTTMDHFPVGEMLQHLNSDEEGLPAHYRVVIFDHGFAKAFWNGGGTIRTSNNYNTYKGNRVDYTSRDVKEWQYHLQQMVLESDPVNYLRKFV